MGKMSHRSREVRDVLERPEGKLSRAVLRGLEGQQRPSGYPTRRASRLCVERRTHPEARITSDSGRLLRLLWRSLGEIACQTARRSLVFLRHSIKRRWRRFGRSFKRTWWRERRSLPKAGLWDRLGQHCVVVDVDGTRQAARQRALPQLESLPDPGPSRRALWQCRSFGRCRDLWPWSHRARAVTMPCWICRRSRRLLLARPSRYALTLKVGRIAPFSMVPRFPSPQPDQGCV